MDKQQFNKLVQDTTNALRCGHEGKGNRLLAQVLEQMLPLCSQFTNEDMLFMQSVLPILADAQQRGDMIYLSDLLQYEVLPRVMKG